MTAGSVTQVWEYSDWSGIPLRQMRGAVLAEIGSRRLPALGDMTVTQLMGMSLGGDPSPVGIYIWTDGDRIQYLGKTHGRSLAERIVTHLDSREPTGDGWSMSCCAAALATQRGVGRDAAVQEMLRWKTLWLRIPPPAEGFHQEHIAVVEGRLKWVECLDPLLVSNADRVRTWFSHKGHREVRSGATQAGDEGWIIAHKARLQA
jgi:hypothetical protein